eukprot:COSAG06_NODE_25355_length_639_cov_0.777778_1_plen_164_part_01
MIIELDKHLIDDQDPCEVVERGVVPWVEGRSNGRLNVSACCPGDPKDGFGGVGLDLSYTSRTEACHEQVQREVELVSNGVLHWVNPPYNFDRIDYGVQTMFYMATTEGWVDIMHSGQDTPSRPGLAPVQDYNWFYCIYFVAFQMIGAAFSMSLFTGVLVNYFAE